MYGIRRRDAAIKAHQEQLRKDQERKERERKEELQRKRKEEVMRVFIILLAMYVPRCNNHIFLVFCETR